MKSCEREKWLKTPRGEFKSQPAGGRPMSLLPGTFCRHQRLKQSPSEWHILSLVISWWLVMKGRQSVSSWEQSCLLRFFFFKSYELWVAHPLYPGISACTSAILWNHPQMVVFKITSKILHTYCLIGCNRGNERGRRLHAPFSKHSRNGLKALTTTAVGDCLSWLTQSVFRKQTQCWLYLGVFFHFCFYLHRRHPVFLQFLVTVSHCLSKGAHVMQ